MTLRKRIIEIDGVKYYADSAKRPSIPSTTRIPTATARAAEPIIRNIDLSANQSADRPFYVAIRKNVRKIVMNMQKTENWVSVLRDIKID